mmetsp:Transcript_14134/g.36278  ORF Transcript_14134/g.36278 Transcript_14134/m.36278 type:complete len:304 (-) Transcript_14134:271-1182(-)
MAVRGLCAMDEFTVVRLCSEYKWLPWAGASMQTLAMLLPPDRPNPFGLMLTVPVMWATAVCLVLLWCVHRYDLALQRAQARGRQRGVPVGPDFTFQSGPARVAYEHWRMARPSCRAVDWASVAFALVVQFKISRKASCTGMHLLFTSPPTVTALFRVVCSRQLTCHGYSVPSLVAMGHICVGHIFLLLSGDNCIGSMAEEGLSGFTIGAVFSAGVACASLVVWPVSQAYMPFKAGLYVVGWTFTAYAHIMFNRSALDSSLQESMWGLLKILYGSVMGVSVSLLLRAGLSEVEMDQFLSTYQQT